MESVLTKPYQYRIVECLGEGLNSCVYRAFKQSNELNVRFEVALKILKSKNLEALWRNEFERLICVKSRHCVALHGWELINNSPALVLEYVRGVNLAELVKYVELNKENIDCIYGQACRGLRDLAQVALFHGDLNLNNIMVDDTGIVKLVDFGVRNGHKDYLVTPKFAAPSVLMGEEPNIETDIFSLEAICLEIELNHSSHVPDDGSVGGPKQVGNAPEFATHDLAKKVRIAMKRRENERVRTNAYKAPRSFRLSRQTLFQSIGVGFICLFFSILSQGDSTRHLPTPPARLIVRTVKWVKIAVNGHDYGYSPINISLSATRMVHLQWFGSAGRGERTIALIPGQTKFLTDNFFSPDSK